MKKLFTLVLFAMAAFAVQAETVADYVRNIGTFTAGGTCNLSGSVKIHVNKDAVSGIQFANGYTTDGVLNDNYVTVTCEGGFKAGDVITIAGAFNNDDDTKLTAIDIFTANEDKTYNVLFTTQQFINGKHAEGDPVEETFTLEEDVDVLCLGRNGKTGTFITVFKVVRDGEETPLEPEVIPDVEEGVIFDGAMIAGNNSKEWVDKFGTIESSSAPALTTLCWYTRTKTTCLASCSRRATRAKSSSILTSSFIPTWRAASSRATRLPSPEPSTTATIRRRLPSSPSPLLPTRMEIPLSTSSLPPSRSSTDAPQPTIPLRRYTNWKRIPR